MTRGSASRRATPPTSVQPYVVVLGLFVVAAMVLGGGGSPSPVSELLLQLAAVVLATALVFGPARMRGVNWPRPRAWLVAFLVLLIPAIQLIPLPPAVWTALPGRESLEQALALVGVAESWRPWSMFPSRTLAGMLAIVVPAILMLAVSRLDDRDHRLLLVVVAATAVASLALGALQLAGGPWSWLRFYSQSNPGFLNGFQANRNAQADILLIGMVALIAVAGTELGRKAWGSVRGIVAIGLVLLALGVFLTGSRTGIAMLVPVAGVAATRVVHMRRRPLVAAAAIGAGIGALVILAADSRVIDRVAQRFALTDDARFNLWSDAIYAIGTYWPFGTGIGSAGPVLTAVEQLEFVDPTRPNRVHNDFLELLLETGVFGPIVLAAVVAVLGWTTVLRFRNRTVCNRDISFAALAILAIIAIHSLVDYPLRSMALACLAAVGAGILLAGNRETAHGSRDGDLV